MSLAPREDLFEDTKMSFGEHLEELRKCFIKSLFWIVLGVAIGLIFADKTVMFIQSPVTDALETYYMDQAQKEYMALNKIEDEEDIPDYVMARLGEKAKDDDKMVFQSYSFVTAELKRALDIVPNEDDDQEFVELTLWQKVENDDRLATTTLSAQEAFMVWLKAGLVSGLVLSSPAIFYHIWAFVAAGLYPHEKRYVNLFLPFSIVLFLAGASLAFFFVFQFVLKFLFAFNADMGLKPDLRISEWMGFVIFMPLGFGISFQLPLVMLFLNRIGIFSVQQYLEKWRIAILVIAILSMVLTPADPISMLAMFIPLTMLFFGGILLCQYLPRGRSLFEAPESSVVE